MPIAVIESLDHEGRGVTHVDGKAIFVEGALPRETVEFSSFKRKPAYEQATATAIRRASAWRTQPRCRYFGICGGCSMQHLDAAAQAAAKQRVLEDTLWHIGRLRPETMLPRHLRTGVGLSSPRAARGTRWWRRRAACWSGFTSAAAASSPT